MIVGRDDEVDGHYVGTRLAALVIPSGTSYVGDRTQLAIRSSAASLVLGVARVWVPLAALAWPLMFGWVLRAWIEAGVLAVVAFLLHRPLELPDAEKKKLRLLGSQTGLRIDPSRLLPATRKGKLEMLEALMTKGGLAPDPEWLVLVLDEIPGPALPLVYAYARYASDAPPWSDCAEKVYEHIERNELV